MPGRGFKGQDAAVMKEDCSGRGVKVNTAEMSCSPLSFKLQLNCKDGTSLPGEQANGSLCLTKEISAAFSRDRTHVDHELLLGCSQSTQKTTSNTNGTSQQLDKCAFSAVLVIFFIYLKQCSCPEPWYPTALSTCDSMLMLLILGREVKRVSEILTLSLNLMWDLMVSRQWQIHHSCHNSIRLHDCLHMDRIFGKLTFIVLSSKKAKIFYWLLVFKGYLIFHSSSLYLFLVFVSPQLENIWMLWSENYLYIIAPWKHISQLRKNSNELTSDLQSVLEQVSG